MCRNGPLVAEFDEKGYWELPGLHSCAHRLNWQCGIGMNAAREKVRVARALKGLPKIDAAFARGEISQSMVCAIPPAIMRALRIRDGGCRFPGCTRSRFVDGRHIEHWAHGGETSLDNLVLLCRHHHRLVHEGGFGCERGRHGGVIFKSPRGNVIPPAFTMSPPPSVNEPVAWIAGKVECGHIDARPA